MNKECIHVHGYDEQCCDKNRSRREMCIDRIQQNEQEILQQQNWMEGRTDSERAESTPVSFDGGAKSEGGHSDRDREREGTRKRTHPKPNQWAFPLHLPLNVCSFSSVRANVHIDLNNAKSVWFLEFLSRLLCSVWKNSVSWSNARNVHSCIKINDLLIHSLLLLLLLLLRCLRLSNPSINNLYNL